MPKPDFYGKLNCSLGQNKKHKEILSATNTIISSAFSRHDQKSDYHKFPSAGNHQDLIREKGHSLFLYSGKSFQYMHHLCFFFRISFVKEIEYCKQRHISQSSDNKGNVMIRYPSRSKIPRICGYYLPD